MLPELVSSFLLERRASGCTSKTLTWHQTSLGRLAEWVERSNTSVDPNAWTATTLRQFIVDLQTHPSSRGVPLSGTSVRTYTASVLAFVRWLYKEEFIERDIAKNVKKPKAPQAQKQPYSDDDLRHLLDAAKRTRNGTRDYAMLCVLLDCGLRASELCNLTLEQVLTAQNILFIRHGKGQKDRAVPFSHETSKAILRYVMKQRRSDSSYLFVSERGGKLLPNSLLQLIERLAKSVGVDGANVHRFRRSFAVGFLRNGGDSLILQRLMGHTTLQMVNTYVALVNEDLQRSHAAASPLANLARRS